MPALTGAGAPLRCLHMAATDALQAETTDDGAAGPSLGLLSHVDTVLADPEDWSRDPWSGEVVDGFLWGRGAQDMKSQTAAEVVAAASLAREGWRPAHGDLLVVAAADEETGGGEGA